jgi:hypothetical protein
MLIRHAQVMAGLLVPRRHEKLLQSACVSQCC